MVCFYGLVMLVCCVMFCLFVIFLCGKIIVVLFG